MTYWHDGLGSPLSDLPDLDRLECRYCGLIHHKDKPPCEPVEEPKPSRPEARG